MSNDTWYTVKIEANVSTDTFNVYVNGNLQKSGATFRNAVSSIDKIRFGTTPVNPAMAYVDDVKVWEGSLLQE